MIGHVLAYQQLLNGASYRCGWPHRVFTVAGAMAGGHLLQSVPVCRMLLILQHDKSG